LWLLCKKAEDSNRRTQLQCRGLFLVLGLGLMWLLCLSLQVLLLLSGGKGLQSLQAPLNAVMINHYHNHKITIIISHDQA